MRVCARRDSSPQNRSTVTLFKIGKENKDERAGTVGGTLPVRCQEGVPAYAERWATLVSKRRAVWSKPAAIDRVAVHRGAKALLAAIADPVRIVPAGRAGRWTSFTAGC